MDAHHSYYQEPLRELLNFSGRCQVVSCDMNFDAFCDRNPERPFESMARRLVLNSFNGSSENRIRRALGMCREQEIDGVVYFCHWGCKQTLGAAGKRQSHAGSGRLSGSDPGRGRLPPE